APCTPAPDPTRTHRPENCEQTVHPFYGYLYVADACEGLITIPAATTIDGNPLNNFLHREVTFNPDGILCGARFIGTVGTYAYICCNAGVVVVSLDDPKHPKVTAVLGEEDVKHPVALAAQFRYAYVCDEEGVKTLDITDPAHPKAVSKLEMSEAHSIYLARTY